MKIQNNLKNQKYFEKIKLSVLIRFWKLASINKNVELNQRYQNTYHVLVKKDVLFCLQNVLSIMQHYWQKIKLWPFFELP